jgi:hypothetical protein
MGLAWRNTMIFMVWLKKSMPCEESNGQEKNHLGGWFLGGLAGRSQIPCSIPSPTG